MLLIKCSVSCNCIIIFNGGTLLESYLAPRGNVFDTAGCNYFEDQDTFILI